MKRDVAHLATRRRGQVAEHPVSPPYRPVALGQDVEHLLWAQLAPPPSRLYANHSRRVGRRGVRDRWGLIAHDGTRHHHPTHSRRPESVTPRKRPSRLMRDLGRADWLSGAWDRAQVDRSGSSKARTLAGECPRPERAAKRA